MVIIMRLFLSELRKLLGNAKMLFLIGTAVLINLVFLIIPEFNEFTPASYNLIWDKLGELEPSARANFIAELILSKRKRNFPLLTPKTLYPISQKAC